MSIVEELGAQVRAAADELPVALVTEALDRLRQAADRLRWVRQESADPMGVPELSAATEHAETAGHTLRVAQDQFAAYLAAIGLAGDGPPAAGQPQRREPADDQPTAGPGPVPEPQGEAGPVHRWWSVRVTELTGQRDSPEAKPDREITDAEDLLRRVAERVRADDRGQLHAQLRDVPADVGLGMAAVAPPMLRDLAAERSGTRPGHRTCPDCAVNSPARPATCSPGFPPRCSKRH